MPAVLTYKLKRACGNTRPWSMQCTNSFAIDQCGPLDCVLTPPATICVGPGNESVYCDTCKDRILPKYWRLQFTLGDGTVLGPVTIQMGTDNTSCGTDPDLRIACAAEYRFPKSDCPGPGLGDDPAYKFILVLVAMCHNPPVIRAGCIAGTLSSYTSDTDISVGDGCQQYLYFDYDGYVDPINPVRPHFEMWPILS